MVHPFYTQDPGYLAFGRRRYDDGDKEHLSWTELEGILLPADGRGPLNQGALNSQFDGAEQEADAERDAGRSKKRSKRGTRRLHAVAAVR